MGPWGHSGTGLPIFPGSAPSGQRHPQTPEPSSLLGSLFSSSSGAQRGGRRWCVAGGWTGAWRSRRPEAAGARPLPQQTDVWGRGLNAGVATETPRAKRSKGQTLGTSVYLSVVQPGRHLGLALGPPGPLLQAPRLCHLSLPPTPSSWGRVVTPGSSDLQPAQPGGVKFSLEVSPRASWGRAQVGGLACSQRSSFPGGQQIIRLPDTP